MALELTGKIIKLMNPVNGEGKNGPWKKQEFVIEFNEGQYPRKVCLSAWGDKIEALNRYKEGDNITVGFNVESREYNERWYTDLRAWRIGSAQNTPQSNDPYTQQPQSNNYNAEPLPASSTDDDLPF